MIVHYPTKVNKNRFITFWLNKPTNRHTQTEKPTDRPIHADKNITSTKDKFLARHEINKKGLHYVLTITLFINVSYRDDPPTVGKKTAEIYEFGHSVYQ